VLAGLSGLIALAAAPAMAGDPLTLKYSTVSGSNPAGTAPWLTALIQDTVTDTVTITLTSNLQDPDEFFPGALENTSFPFAIAFNIKDPIPSPITTPQTGACVGTGCQPFSPQLDQQTNNINLPGTAFSGFDLGLLVGGPANRFNASNVITFTLTGTGLSAASFKTTNTLASGATGAYCSAAQVGGIGTPATGTAVIAAFCDDLPPESAKVPAPLPLLGAGMAFGFSRRLRRRVHASADSAQASIG
jgi:hypothetical protein